MLLGTMKRTGNMVEFALDLNTSEEPHVPSEQNITAAIALNRHQQMGNLRQTSGCIDLIAEWKLRNNSRPPGAAPTVLPLGLCRNSGDLSVNSEIETGPFLGFCGLCMRRLNPGHDIFMYRGEIAFCSSECRQQLMNQEERKEKCSLSSMKKHTAPATSASSEPSGAGEEVVAAA